MSRRRGEFANRTSIFEGAFRAWSHLGGLAPEDVESRPARELDPLDFPLAYDARWAAAAGQKKKKGKEDAAAEAATGGDGGGGERGGDNRDDADGAEEDPYPYEPLPRAGLAHPFVRAILSSWLGPNADPESVRLGLTTLRTWWQHRRKGESGSARAALGSARMREIVNAYVRHFFRAALCLVATDGEEPPRTLRDRTRARDEAGGRKRKRGPATATAAKAPPGEFPDLRPRGQCIPRDIDLPDLVRRVNAAATQLAHRGRPRDRLSPTAGGGDDDGDDHRRGGVASPRPAAFPVPLAVAGPPAAAGKGGPRDVAFGMAISGITCAHCVKIVETVLLGCPGSPLGSPIAGLLDAAADLELELLLLKVEDVRDSPRIAFEAARNLALVGYEAVARSVAVPPGGTPEELYEVMTEILPRISTVAGQFDWTRQCVCPVGGIKRQGCPRHSQMGSGAIEVFDKTERLVSNIVIGCRKRTGLPSCTAGVHCYCQGSYKGTVAPTAAGQEPPLQPSPQLQIPPAVHPRNPADLHADESYKDPPNPAVPREEEPYKDPQYEVTAIGTGGQGEAAAGNQFDGAPVPSQRERRFSQFSLGSGGLAGVRGRHSFLSETTFDRSNSGISALSRSNSGISALSRSNSGLSALSKIDWDDMSGFDVNVDYSAGINDDIIAEQTEPQQEQPQDKAGPMDGGEQQPQAEGGITSENDGPHDHAQQPSGGRMVKRSSLRRSIHGNPNSKIFNVSFNMENNA